MSGFRKKRSQFRPEDFTVGWICALPIELAAARQLLDDEYECCMDTDSYTLGRVGGNYVVLACLPAGQIGTNSAAVISTKLQTKFPSIRLGLMVGIGGGVPSTTSDIRLGDVVVSQPTGGSGGVIQYDFGKTGASGQLKPTGFLNAPPTALLNAIAKVQANHHNGRNMMAAHLSAFDRSPQFSRENTGPDILFEPTYNHVGGTTCKDCSRQGRESIVQRDVRENQKPQVHYGIIASGNQVMKDGVTREKLRSELGDVLCFEMEAAGLMNSFPCVVIRGICDYADSHKNKTWQGHAAAVAAAYAKELLLVLHAADKRTLPILDGGLMDRGVSPLYPIHSLRLDSTSTWEQRSNSTETIASTHNAETHPVFKILLESLSFRRMDGRLSNIRTAHSKTCTWLFGQAKFEDWLDNGKVAEHHGFLWLKGKPGSGKSTIMKTALAWTKRKRSRETVISYFFNARASSVLEKSSLGMYRLLVHQLVQEMPYLQTDLTHQFSNKERDGVVDDWTVEELQNFLLHVVVTLKERPLTIYIDALDEGEETDIRQMIVFLEEIGQLAIDNERCLRICLSSRHYPHISIKKGLELVVERQPGHDHDIVTYVRNHLTGDGSTEMEALRTELCIKASGVFLWVVLVVPILNSLYDKGHIDAMKLRLKDIPKELTGLFAEILARDVENADTSILLLQWTLFARRPLSPVELYCAVRSVSTNSQKVTMETTSKGIVERYILNCSKGLTEVTKSEPPTVQFIHETVRDFLLRDNGLAKLRPVLLGKMIGLSQDELTRCCSRYLFDVVSPSVEFLENEDHCNRFPFLEYAVCNILYHADAADGNAVSQRDFVRSLCDDSMTNFKKWICLSNLFQRYKVRRYTMEASLLYIVSEQNLSNLLTVLINNSVDVNIPGERYGNALQAACANGHEEIVRLLIESHADVNRQGGEHRHPLLAAIFRKDHAIADLLLKSGAIVPPDLLEKRVISTLDRGFVPGAKYLLEAGGDFCSKSGFLQGSLLYEVAGRGHPEIVQLLLEKGADVNVFGGTYGSALTVAALNGHISTVQLLLENGADVNASGGRYGSALAAAAFNGHTSIVQPLLENGADVNVFGGTYGSALTVAALNGHISTVQLLLENGADVNASGGHYGSALAAAAFNGHTSIVQPLLENGADVNASGGHYGSALAAAALDGHTSTVQLLLENGADVNASGGHYGSALAAAALRGHTLIVQPLLENGADVNASGGHYGSALAAAAFNGHTSIVQPLLENGADVNASGAHYGSVLAAAALDGHTSTVQLLLENGADVNASGGHYGSALAAAALRGHTSTVQLLLENGADVNASGGHYGSVLAAAALDGHTSTVQLLLENGART